MAQVVYYEGAKEGAVVRKGDLLRASGRSSSEAQFYLVMKAPNKRGLALVHLSNGMPWTYFYLPEGLSAEVFIEELKDKGFSKNVDWEHIPGDSVDLVVRRR